VTKDEKSKDLKTILNLITNNYRVMIGENHEGYTVTEMVKSEKEGKLVRERRLASKEDCINTLDYSKIDLYSKINKMNLDFFTRDIDQIQYTSKSIKVFYYEAVKKMVENHILVNYNCGASVTDVGFFIVNFEDNAVFVEDVYYDNEKYIDVMEIDMDFARKYLDINHLHQILRDLIPEKEIVDFKMVIEINKENSCTKPISDLPVLCNVMTYDDEEYEKESIIPVTAVFSDMMWRETFRDFIK
jgi:hypothetical protein